MSQFHERVDREEQLGLEPTFTQAVADLLDDPGRQGIFTFRLGRSTKEAPPSPRRAMTAVLDLPLAR